MALTTHLIAILTRVSMVKRYSGADQSELEKVL